MTVFFHKRSMTCTLNVLEEILCPFYMGSDELQLCNNTIINLLPFYTCTVYMYILVYYMYMFI